MEIFRVSVDEDDSSVNLKIETWITPKTEEEKDYSRIDKKLSKSVRQFTYGLKKLIGFEDYIIDLDLRPSGIRYGKKSYMSCNILLFGSSEKIKKEEFLNLLNGHLTSNENFNFTKNKMDNKMDN